MLPHDEQRKLIHKAQSGDRKARDLLVKTNLRFVVMIAKDYYTSGVGFEDLISSGNLGLITAIDKWDTKNKVTFLSYAVWWIRRSMQKFIREEGFLVRKPDNILKARAAISKEREELEKKTGYAPDSIVASNLGLDESSVVDNDAISRNQFVPEIDDEGYSVFDDLDSGDRADKNDDLKKEINRLLKKLTPTDKQIIELYFGLNNNDAISLPAIADKLGYSTQNVSYRLRKGLNKLKRYKKTLSKF